MCGYTDLSQGIPIRKVHDLDGAGHSKKANWRVTS
jgi:hypothetical protein